MRSGSTVQELREKDLADFLIRKTGIAWDDAFEDRGNRDFLEISTLSRKELYAFKELSKILLGLSAAEVDIAIKNGDFIEVKS